MSATAKRVAPPDAPNGVTAILARQSDALARERRLSRIAYLATRPTRRATRPPQPLPPLTRPRAQQTQAPGAPNSTWRAPGTIEAPELSAGRTLVRRPAWLTSPACVTLDAAQRRSNQAR
jgi:hypothetical protein